MDKVRCNNCMKVFFEDKIVVKDEIEFCPKCKKSGALMDDFDNNFVITK